MKPMRISAVFLFLLACIVPSAAVADGFIVPVRPEIRVRGHWAVKYHHVDITVRDQVASVTVDQEFVNTGSGMIEVEYFFPLPPGVAIDAMTLVVDGKEYSAKLLEADKARKIYEDIVRRKKDPALLEYVNYGLFKTSAFPLQKDKPCKVVVTYKQICPKDGDMVELWYPLNTEKFSARTIEDVRVTADIKSRADITAVYSPTHDLNVERKDLGHVIATYQEKDVLPTTDFQIFYRAANEEIGATLLTHQPQKNEDGYFLMLVSPNPQLGEGDISEKDVVIVFDHSGSMSGSKLRQAKEAVRYILEHLNPGDRFDVVPYSDTIEPIFGQRRDATKENIRRAMEDLDRINPVGGTNILGALEEGLRIIGGNERMEENRPKFLIFLTDGLPTVGETDEGKILETVDDTCKGAVRLFTFGVGYDVNIRMLDRLAMENKGRSNYVKPKEPIEQKVSALYNKIRNPVVTDLEIELEGVRIRDMYPREPGDLFDGDQIVIAGRYDANDATDLKETSPGVYATQLSVRGAHQGKERSFRYDVEICPGTERRGLDFVEKLWAIRRVGYLLDQVQLHGESKEVVDEIIRLSREYGIMTPYTSFLADETTKLHDREDLSRRARENMGVLADSAESGRDADRGRAQRGAAMRQELNEAKTVPANSAPAGPARASGTRMYGNTAEDAYEQGKAETVSSVRQVGNQAVYRQGGNTWVAANAADVDLESNPEAVETIDRFSEEYFRLVRANTIEENQVLATQQAGEELVIRLRGQVYRIR